LIWTPGTYTARAVAGEQGELRSELAENAHRVREEILTATDEGLWAQSADRRSGRWRTKSTRFRAA
jgi:hypothetical protein